MGGGRGVWELFAKEGNESYLTPASGFHFVTHLCKNFTKKVLYRAVTVYICMVAARYSLYFYQIL